MPTIPFPKVPNVPGVPAIPRSPNVSTSQNAALGLVQALIWRVVKSQVRWGVFDKAGKPLGDPSQFTGLIGTALDSVGIGATLSTGAVDYSKETKVSDFPIEKGSFASYNKVETPAAPIVTLHLSGSENNRRTFLDEIDKAVKSMDFYSVVTPEVTYINYSIERYNYSRTNVKGATLMSVELTLKEIREVSSQYSQSSGSQILVPKDVGAAASVDNGKIQAKTPDTSTLKKIANKIPSLSDLANRLIGQ